MTAKARCKVRKVQRTDARRRGIATVYVALAAMIIMALAALSIDMGTAYTAKNEMQRAADAAALAGALHLIQGGMEGSYEEILDRASSAVENNGVHGMYMSLGANDLKMGSAVLNAYGKYEFQPGAAPWDAISVTLRRGEGSAYSAIPSLFGKFLGKDSFNIEARSTAMLVPRDIAVVIDLSGSMNYDSLLMHWNRNDGGYSNARDIWASLDGPPPSRPYFPGPEWATEYAGDSGPTFGLLNNWGQPLVPGLYEPSSDPGLIHIPKGSNTSNSKITNSLTQRGYSADERSVLMSSSNDSNSTLYNNRVLVMLGLADWRSGRSGGKFGAGNGGNGDNKVDSNELVNWAPYPDVRVGNWTWSHYVAYAWSSSLGTEFRHRFGLKTFVDFICRHASYRPANQTRRWETPELPLWPLKDALQVMVDTITEEAPLDRMSLEIFASTAKHEISLTDNLQLIADRLYDMQAGHYDGNTAISAGLVSAMSELQSESARPNASKLIVLMSDGVPNSDENGNVVSSAAGRSLALDRAQQAVDLGFTVYCVSVGYLVDRPLMQQMAAIGRGQEFYAAGNPQEYMEQLEDIFRQLGGKRPVALIE